MHLFFGARAADGLYDLDSLDKMAAQYSWRAELCSISAVTAAAEIDHIRLCRPVLSRRRQLIKDA